MTYNVPKFLELRVDQEDRTIFLEQNTTVVDVNDIPTILSENKSYVEITSSFSENDRSANNSTTSIFVNSSNSTETILPTELRLNPWYIKIYLTYINMITHGFVPMITLTVINMRIYKQVEEMYLSVWF